MSRRKQSNPKPLKSDLAHENASLEFPADNEENRKGEATNWTEKSASTSPETVQPPSGNNGTDTGNMVTVLDTSPNKNETADGPSPEAAVADCDDRKSPTKPESEEKQPRIRLKPGLATDPALMLGNVKNEMEAVASQTTPEYLPVIQSALGRGLIFPTALNLNEAVVAMAAAQRAASTEVARAGSVEPIPTAVEAVAAATRSSVPVYQCVPCGIRFSSLSTLEAHQTYYCSHRPNKPSDDDPKVGGASSESATGQSETDGPDGVNKGLRAPKQYTCMHCSYSADKKVSLNRHMRMHTVSPGPATGPPAVTSSSTSNGETNPADAQDRYCAECDIRFSSQKTYRAHKMHYCNSRHVVKSAPAPSSCTSGSSPTSPADTSSCRTPPSPSAQLPSQQPFLALPTNPIIILPYSLFRSASVLPSISTTAGVRTPDAPCFLMPDGTLQPMTSALASASVTGGGSGHMSGEQVLKTINKSNKDPPIISRESAASAPLDLTVRRSPSAVETTTKKDGDMEVDLDYEKENVKHQSPSPDKMEREPSIRSSPCSTPGTGFDKASGGTGTSPKRKFDDVSRSNSPRSSKTPRLSVEKVLRTSPEAALSAGAPFDLTPALHPLLLRSGNIPPALFPAEAQMRLADLPTLPPVMPQVIVKQGVSKCKECNIVFCKHENYLVHKKHYCFARPTEDDGSKTSGSPPVSPRSGGTTSPAAQYQQLICLACGIKFTSPDNLNAHQQYYCLKRNESEPKRCAKCRAIFEPGHQCTSHTAVAGWKCPCCDVISATASAAQRHMETHTGVKAYRCTICKYKGNTLRGMKTHIRMHFDKRAPDLQEEKYISYILEDDAMGAAGMEVAIAPNVAVLSDDMAQSHVMDSRPEPHHACVQCPYSSQYKANVVRHIKLVHGDDVSNGDDRAGCSTKNMPQIEEEDEIIVKKEAMEPEVIIAQVDDTPIKEEPELSTTPKSTSRSLDEEILQEAAKPGAHYCKSCDIHFNYPNSFIAHKKFYCSSHAGEISNANNNNNTGPRTAETSVL